MIINRIIVVGRLTRNPELRRTSSDVAVASFTLAVDDREKDEKGEFTTTFIDVTTWRETAESVTKFCRKGHLVAVDGRLHQRSYLTREGAKRVTYEIIADSVQFLEPKKDLPQGETFIDEPVQEDSNNLDDIDVTEDNLPF